MTSTSAIEPAAWASLRDLIAMRVNITPLDMAMAQAVMGYPGADIGNAVQFMCAAEARYRYMLADAMLAERNRV